MKSRLNIKIIKIIFTIILISFTNSTSYSQYINCEEINKLISLAFENDEFKNSLHFELKERKPFLIYYQTKCTSNSPFYLFIENEVENCLILKNIEYLEKKYYLNIYYPLEGMSISLTYKKKKTKVKLCKINVIEL